MMIITSCNLIDLDMSYYGKILFELGSAFDQEELQSLKLFQEKYLLLFSASSVS